MKLKVLAFAAAAALLVPGIAAASVTFNDATGYGFVDREDVQAAFGWNYGQLRKQASDVSFSVVDNWIVFVYCFSEGEYGPGTVIGVTNTTSLYSTVATRGPGRITGFDLLGYTTPRDSSSSWPRGGEPCVMPDGTAGVTEVEGKYRGGALIASWNGTSVYLLGIPEG